MKEATKQAETKTWELTEFQKGIPGPAKLPMVEADCTGAVNTDVRFIADRLAILNHVSAYSYLIDERRWDAFFALFSDDILFQTTTPGIGTVEIRGKAAFRATTTLRYPPTTAMRRHTMGNIHVARQTETEAEVRTYLLISSVPAADRLDVLSSGTYNCRLEKRDGRWTIVRWYIEIDARLAESPMPADAAAAANISFIPDIR